MIHVLRRCLAGEVESNKNDVIKLKHFPRHWFFVRRIHRWPVNSPLKGQWSFDVFFDLRLNKRLSKQSRHRWFETPSHPLWRHCNEFLAIWDAWNLETIFWHGDFSDAEKTLSCRVDYDWEFILILGTTAGNNLILHAFPCHTKVKSTHTLLILINNFEFAQLTRRDAVATLSANGSTAFRWKLYCNWLKHLWQRHVTPSCWIPYPWVPPPIPPPLFSSIPPPHFSTFFGYTPPQIMIFYPGPRRSHPAPVQFSSNAPPTPDPTPDPRAPATLSSLMFFWPLQGNPPLQRASNA